MKLNLGCGKDLLKGHKNLDKPNIDLEKMPPFKNNSVSKIVLKEVIEHIRNHKQLLRECHRILEPHGKLFLTTPNYRSLAHRVMLLFGKDYFYRDYNHVRFFTDRMIVEELKEAGFKIKKVFGRSQTLSFLPAKYAGNIGVCCSKGSNLN